MENRLEGANYRPEEEVFCLFKKSRPERITIHKAWQCRQVEVTSFAMHFRDRIVQIWWGLEYSKKEVRFSNNISFLRCSMSDGFFIVKGDIYTTDRKLKIFIMTVEVISINKINNRVRGKKAQDSTWGPPKLRTFMTDVPIRGLLGLLIVLDITYIKINNIQIFLTRSQSRKEWRSHN